MNFNSDIARIAMDFLAIFLPLIVVITLEIFMYFIDVSMLMKMVFRLLVAVFAACIVIHIIGAYIPVFVRVIVAFIVAIVAYHLDDMIKRKRQTD